MAVSSRALTGILGRDGDQHSHCAPKNPFTGAGGQRLGRPPAMNAEQISQARAILTRPDESVSSIARLLGVSRSTESGADRVEVRRFCGGVCAAGEGFWRGVDRGRCIARMRVGRGVGGGQARPCAGSGDA